jgi:ketosteroid isomerase-like protein
MSPGRMPRLERAIRTVLKFQEAYNRHDVPAMMELVADECVMESNGPPPDGATLAGREIIYRSWQNYFAGTRNAQRQIEDAFSLGTRCVLRWRGEWIDQEGMPRALRGVDLFQVKDGRITEILSYVKG